MSFPFVTGARSQSTPATDWRLPAQRNGSVFKENVLHADIRSMAERRLANGVVLAAMLASAAAFGWFGGALARVGDVWAFADSGSILLSTHWVHAFHVAGVQAGPLELIVAFAASAAGGNPTGFAIALDVVSWSAVAVAAATLLRWRPLDLAVFAASACALSLPAEGYRGHPAELFIGSLWLLAAREARRARSALAGGLVGLSACFEVWGILGVAVLALSPTIRRCAPGAALAAGLPTICFLPFVVGGDFHMFQWTWPALQAPASLIVGYGHPFPWDLRLAEGTAVLLGGVAVARLLRRLPESIWVVPAVIMLLRIRLDPITYGYYYDPALLALFIGGTQLVLHPRALAARIAPRFSVPAVDVTS